MLYKELRVAGFVKESIVDGPGIRYTIFVQGCAHRCKGCQNPETWNMADGISMSVDKIVADIEFNRLVTGVTITGGDPFYQEEAVTQLVDLLNEKGYNIWVYTGFMFEEIKESSILDFIDVLVDGPFILEQKTLSVPFKGSSNQRIIDVRKTRVSGTVVEI